MAKSNNIDDFLKELEEAEANLPVPIDLEEPVKDLERKVAWLLQLLGRGGNANRNEQVDGVNVLRPYTDINWKAGSGVTITAVANNTTKYTDITIASSASGSTLTSETPTGTVDDSNVTFIVLHEPLYIVVNGSQYTVGTGIYVSYIAGVITLSSAVGTGGFIRSFYNA